MARATGRLTALKVERLKSRPGMHADGGGLYLQIKNGGASWVLRYTLNGEPHWMGLGPLALYGLAEARAKALDARRLRHEGIDPIKAREQARQRMHLDAAKAITFKDAAEAYIKSHRAGWRNGKHAAQWEVTLATYAGPVIGPLPVQAIDTALVLKVLEPIWTAKTETASRLRQRIERVLDWATARGYRQGENPARWRGHLENLLPKRSRVQPVEHHRALPYDEIGEFMAALRAQEGVDARALEFTILTAARSGETLGAMWGEIDLAEKVWVVPADRIKAGKEHRVPLSAKAVAILEAMKPGGAAEFVFPGSKPGRPLGNMALPTVLERMGRKELTVHGFRSTFRDWAAERTSYPREAAEMALAHAVGDKVEAAYRRGDLFEKRRRLMDAWATYCGAAPKQGANGNVATLRQAS